MNLSMILAVDLHNNIGLEGKLPWGKIKKDMEFFKQTTLHKPVIMGRKTWESLPNKPLKLRYNMVVSNTKKFEPYYESIESAVNNAKKLGFNEAVFIGGKEIYKQAIGMVDRVYLTTINGVYTGDTVFQLPDMSKKWKRVLTKCVDSEQDGVPKLTFQIFDRK